jgi:hypothetical protein
MYLLVLLAGLLCAAGCGQRSRSPASASDGGVPDFPTADASTCPGCVCKDPTGDEDSDGIDNGAEGCVVGRDTDGDKIPDWKDSDSDNDGIVDALETGKKGSHGRCAHTDPPRDKWPCDSDGDGWPDYIDVDSDGDGLLDRDEDVNGDGLLGCCLLTCNKPGSKQQASCKLNSCGCGPGQIGVMSECRPAAAVSCANGETDPTSKDTYGDGQLDNDRAWFICRDATEDYPMGRLPLKERASATGDWRVAFAPAGAYKQLTISGAGAKEAAATIDQASDGVAGFVVSRGTTHATVTEALAAQITAVQAALGGAWSVTQVASGILAKSHDSYDAVTGTTLRLSTAGAGAKVTALRAKILAAMLGRSPSQLGNLPASVGGATPDLVLRMTTVKRVDFKLDTSGGKVLDAAGYPVDSGDKNKWRLVVIGALAAWSAYHNSTPQPAGFGVDDLADGSGLARHETHLVGECDVSTITKLPKADLIWVIDESGSMQDSRSDIVNNANNLFSRALASGLDFRMGITGVNSPTGSHAKTVGRFCSKVSTNTSYDGGLGRFLLPSEQTTFSACIKNPPGYEGDSEYGLVNAAQAVKLHLPRATNSPSLIRTDAELTIIVVTDEPPQSLYPLLGTGSWPTSCTLGASEQGKLDSALQPYMALFSGATDPEARASLHFIGGLCGNSCNAMLGHGYHQLAWRLGGQNADVCQMDLGQSMQAVIDSVIVRASPLKLKHHAVSASLVLAMDGVSINRSRTNGFEPRAAGRKLLFRNVKYKNGSEVTAAYFGWREGLLPCP